MGVEPITPILQGSVAPNGMEAQSDFGIQIVDFGLLERESKIGKSKIQNRVTEVGVEPTKSRGSRPRRFSSLRTRPRKRLVLVLVARPLH